MRGGRIRSPTRSLSYKHPGENIILLNTPLDHFSLPCLSSSLVDGPHQTVRLSLFLHVSTEASEVLCTLWECQDLFLLPSNDRLFGQSRSSATPPSNHDFARLPSHFEHKTGQTVRQWQHSPLPLSRPQRPHFARRNPNMRHSHMQTRRSLSFRRSTYPSMTCGGAWPSSHPSLMRLSKKAESASSRKETTSRRD